MGVLFTYSIIVDIPFPNSLRAALSTYNLGMQYLGDNGFIGNIMGDYKNTRECYISTFKATISLSKI